jgi:hypothetical protein
MTVGNDDVLPSATSCRGRIAEVEAEKASEHDRQLAAAAAENKAPIEAIGRVRRGTDEARRLDHQARG